MNKQIYMKRGMHIALAIVLLFTSIPSVFTADAAVIYHTDDVHATNVVRIEKVSAQQGGSGVIKLEVVNEDVLIGGNASISFDPTKITLSQEVVAEDRISAFGSPTVDYVENSSTQATLRVSFFTIESSVTLEPGSGPIYSIPYQLNPTVTDTVPITISESSMMMKNESGGNVEAELTTEDGEVTIQQSGIDGLNPTSGYQGRNMDVTFSGINVDWNANTPTADDFDFGAGISVMNVTAVSSTELKVRIAINSDANLGARTVTLSTNGQSLSVSNGFTVEESPSGATVYFENTDDLIVDQQRVFTITVAPGETPVSGVHLSWEYDTDHFRLTRLVHDRKKLDRIVTPISCTSAGKCSYSALAYNVTFTETFPIAYVTLQAQKPTTDTGTLLSFIHDEYPPVDISGPNGSVMAKADDSVVHITSESIVRGIVLFEWNKVSSAHDNKSIPLEVRLYASGEGSIENTPQYSFVVQTDRYGRFELPPVPVDAYDIMVRSRHSLNNVRKNEQLKVGIGSYLSFGYLVDGDMIDRYGQKPGDEQILITDATWFVYSMNKSAGDPEFRPETDFNSSGKTDTTDFVYLSRHYNDQGPMIISSSLQARDGRDVSQLITTTAMLAMDTTGLVSDMDTTHTITFTLDPQTTAVNAFNLHYGFDPRAIEVLDLQLTDMPYYFLLEEPVIDNENGFIRASAGVLGEERAVTEPSVVATMTFRVKSLACGGAIQSLDAFPATSIVGLSDTVLMSADNLTIDAPDCGYLPIIEMTNN
ncbi:MAG: hypothetical protein AAF639_07470 [Chloroflexota bacterium]